MKLAKTWTYSKYVAFRTILLIIGMALLVGCGESGGSGDDDDDSGSVPVVNSVSFSQDLVVGEKYDMIVSGIDFDMDIESLILTKYLLPDSENPQNGPTVIPLLPQEDVIHSWELLGLEAFDLPGEYVIVFQLEDRKGNLSDEIGIIEEVTE